MRIAAVWLFVGIVLEAAGFLGLWHPPIAVVLVMPFCFLVWTLVLGWKASWSWTWYEQLLLYSVVGVWCMHAIGIAVPETGFDAVWYHLPVASHMAEVGRLEYWPAYYQSTNPFFCDSFFVLARLLGHGWWGQIAVLEVIAKSISYLFGLSFILITYQLFLQVVRRPWALIGTLTVSVFQVVSWQASSAYIDVARSFFELSALLWLCQPRRSLASGVFFGLLVGAVLGSKTFAILVLPLFLVLFFWRVKPSLFLALSTLFATVSIVLPYYLFAWIHLGHPFYGIVFPAQTLGTFTQESTLVGLAISQFLHLPQSLVYMTLQARDYTTLLFGVFFGLFLGAVPWLWKQTNGKMLLAASVWFWGLWWFVPPVSTRYGLTGFIVLTVCLFWMLAQYCRSLPQYRVWIFTTVALALLFAGAPRVPVVWRQTRFIFGEQQRSEYLQQFDDGLIDTHLQQWQIYLHSLDVL